MRVTCPKCGGQNVRYAHMRTASERWANLLGKRPMRCRDCRTRFVFRLWRLSDLPYARCPECWNMRLTTWSTHHYHVPLGRGILLFFGANPYRCESCRHNFVSFLPRKYRFRRSRRPANPDVPATREDETARGEE
jgi:hypothetical protein